MGTKSAFHLMWVRMFVNKKTDWTNAGEDVGKAPLYNAGKVKLANVCVNIQILQKHWM